MNARRLSSSRRGPLTFAERAMLVVAGAAMLISIAFSVARAQDTPQTQVVQAPDNTPTWVTILLLVVGVVVKTILEFKERKKDKADADELRKFKVARNESKDERDDMLLTAVKLLAKERAETTGNLDLRKLVEKVDEVGAKKPPQDPLRCQIKGAQ